MICSKRGGRKLPLCLVVGHDWHMFESLPSGEWYSCFRCDALSYSPIFGTLWQRVTRRTYRP